MNMRQWMRSITLAVILAAMTVAPRVDARGQPNQEELLRMTQDILSVIANLPDYTVYDWLTFGIKDNVVYLRGFAHRTSLRFQAPAAVKKVKGVKEVKNEIDYTRTPKSDEQLRRQVYRAIYDTFMQRYAKEAMYYTTGARSSLPRGPHPIHIVVVKGDVKLMGYVFSEEDKQTATRAVESVGGMMKTLENALKVRSKQGS